VVFTSLIGCAASAVLIWTLGKQVLKLWREGSVEGVSKWLFIGQITASVLFIAYSLLLHSWIFVVTNVLILVDAILGALIVRRNRRRKAHAQ
jgi:MtN3 and saliva related transmembrane protein